MKSIIRTVSTARPARAGLRVAMLGVVACLASSGCSTLNPAFVSLFDPTGQGGSATLTNAPGHVVIAFINNAEVDERLLNYLESADGGNLTLTDAEKRDLRPRVRVRIRVTFTNGNFQVIEFVDGSSKLVDQNFDAEAQPDLNQNDRDNAVVVCDVARVEVEPGTGVQVFVPVVMQGFQLVEVTNAIGNTFLQFQLTQQQVPQFRVLQIDTVDLDGNPLVRANIGVRDVPSPVDNLLCGSVVTIAMNGVLSVPFLQNFADPSFDLGDAEMTASIGGRFEFIVTVR